MAPTAVPLRLRRLASTGSGSRGRRPALATMGKPPAGPIRCLVSFQGGSLTDRNLSARDFRVRRWQQRLVGPVGLASGSTTSAGPARSAAPAHCLDPVRPIPRPARHETVRS